MIAGPEVALVAIILAERLPPGQRALSDSPIARG